MRRALPLQSSLAPAASRTRVDAALETFIMPRPDLAADCGRCAALCCIATAFDASDDFAFDKPAGLPCSYITRDCQCAIHDEREVRGFRGCTVYDCHGAGPSVTRAFAGDSPARSSAFLVVRPVFEWLWLLTEAAKICPPHETELLAAIAGRVDALDTIASCGGRDLRESDLDPHRESTRLLLLRVGRAVGGRRGLSVIR